MALLVLLLVLPVGVQVCYDASGFTLRLAAGPVRWQLLPSRSGWLWRKLQKSRRRRQRVKLHLRPRQSLKRRVLDGVPTVFAGFPYDAGRCTQAPAGAAPGALG